MCRAAIHHPGAKLQTVPTGCSQGIALETMCVFRIAYIDMPKGLVCCFHSVLQSCTMPHLPDSRSFQMPCVAFSEACLRSRLNGSSFKPCSAIWDASLNLSRPASSWLAEPLRLLRLIDDDKELGRYEKGLMLCVLHYGCMQQETPGSCCIDNLPVLNSEAYLSEHSLFSNRT